MIKIAMRRLLPLLLLFTSWFSTPLSAQPGTQWVRLLSPNFEIYTDAGEKEGRGLLTRFEQVRSFFLRATPVKAPEEFPVRIIAFRSREEFLPFAASPIAAAYFTSNPYRDYIVLPNTSQEMFSLAVHEYTHLVIRHSGLRLPLWLNEGWADVFSSMRQVSDGVAVGDLLRDRVHLLQKGRWLGLSELAAVNQRSPEYHESDRAGVFYSESWALTHMLYLSPEYKSNFAKFLNAIHRGTAFEEAAETAFARPLTKIEDDLHAYLTRKKLVGQVFQVDIDKSRAQAQTTPVASFDSRLMLADLLAVIGQVARASEEYEALAQEKPQSAEVALSLGYAALARRENSEARTFFRKAFDLGLQDPRMCFQLSALMREAKDPTPEILTVLERTVQLKPDFTEALVSLGLLRMDARNYSGAVDALMKVETVTPAAAPGVFTALTYANLQLGFLAEARTHAETAKRYARTEQQSRAIAAMLSLADAREKSAYPPTRGEKLQLATGAVENMACSGAGAKLTVRINGSPTIFELPDPRSVEFTRPRGAAIQLTCGATPQPFPVVVEYAAPNIVRRLEF